MTTEQQQQQQFVLKWHYHETTLLQNLPYLLENDILSDVTISVGAQHIKAHKIILAMCSVYFLQLFQDLKTTQHPVVVLQNTSIEDVKAMLAFIYRGQCVVSEDQLPNLLSIAKLLKIQGLCDMKVPEKTTVVTTEAIPLKENEIEKKEQLLFSETHNNYESVSSCVVQKRKLNDSNIKINSYNNNSSSTAINLSIDNNNTRRSSSAKSPPLLWEKSLRTQQEENTSPCSASSEERIPPFILPITKKLINPSINQNNNNNKEPSETCKCFLCGKYLSNQYNLRVHIETHEETFHACQSCPHVSRSRDALRKHVSYRHPDEYSSRKRKKTDSS